VRVPSKEESLHVETQFPAGAQTRTQKPATESIEGRHTRTDLKGQRLKCPSADVPLIAKINHTHV